MGSLRISILLLARIWEIFCLFPLRWGPYISSCHPLDQPVHIPNAAGSATCLHVRCSQGQIFKCESSPAWPEDTFYLNLLTYLEFLMLNLIRYLLGWSQCILGSPQINFFENKCSLLILNSIRTIWNFRERIAYYIGNILFLSSSQKQ